MPGEDAVPVYLLAESTMWLIRLALLTIDGLEKNFKSRPLSADGIDVGGLRQTTVESTWLLPCRKHLRYRPKLTSENLIVVPKDERIAAEQAIEFYANLISVSVARKRSISSPMPAVCFIAEDNIEKSYLQESDGILRDSYQNAIPASPQTFKIEDHLAALLDRADGVSLLAEALSHAHGTGQFHELMRIFERTFGLAGQSIIDPLSTFLATGRFANTRSEVEDWVDFRNGVSHADRREQIFIEADVLWKLDRVTQAAYDVLLNKKTWTGADPDRRTVWIPISGTLTEDGAMFMTSGEEFRSTFRVFDDFRRYPLHLGAFCPHCQTHGGQALRA